MRNPGWFLVIIITFTAGRITSGVFVMVDLGGYVIILVETTDKKIKLYGELVIFLYFILLITLTLQNI